MLSPAYRAPALPGPPRQVKRVADLMQTTHNSIVDSVTKNPVRSAASIHQLAPGAKAEAKTAALESSSDLGASVTTGVSFAPGRHASSTGVVGSPSAAGGAAEEVPPATALARPDLSERRIAQMEEDVERVSRAAGELLAAARAIPRMVEFLAAAKGKPLPDDMPPGAAAALRGSVALSDGSVASGATAMPGGAKDARPAGPTSGGDAPAPAAACSARETA